VQADHRASDALDELLAAGEITEFYPIPACRSYLCDSTGILPVAKSTRSETTEYELRAYLQRRNNWSDEVYDSISWPAYRSASTKLSDSERTFVVKLTHGWLPIGVRERRCSGTTDKCPQCSEIETVPHLYRCQSSTVAQPVRNTPARAPQRYQNCSRPSPHNHPGIESWFITGDTNDPNSSAITVQIGWFQVLKGYIPEDWTSMQEGFYRSQRSNSEKIYTGKQWTKELIEFF
jgi:hypothetical protein